MKHVFLIGAPRSGTTWLQILLAQNPSVATSSETHLFTYYLNQLEQRWQHEKFRVSAGHKVSGLTQTIDDDRFYELLKGFSDGVFNVIHTNKPEATFLLEKTPEHTLHAELILRVFPEAYFIHIIRDPRAVANSFHKAARSWWGRTQSGPVQATQRWKRNVVEGKNIRNKTSRYMEVRYEDLLDDGPAHLLRIIDWLGIETDIDACKKAVSACGIENLKSGSEGTIKPWSLDKEPEGFFRKGDANAWQTEMSTSRIATVEYVARHVMKELGYEPLGKSSLAALVRISLYNVFETSYKGFKYICDGLIWRIERGLSKL